MGVMLVGECAEKAVIHVVAQMSNVVRQSCG
jgi:hypothetical protein